MALPGSQGYPAPESNMEAASQLIKLVFLLEEQLRHVSSELHLMNGHLQTIAAKVGH
jgi:hypothetical protein